MEKCSTGVLDGVGGEEGVDGTGADGGSLVVRGEVDMMEGGVLKQKSGSNGKSRSFSW